MYSGRRFVPIGGKTDRSQFKDGALGRLYQAMGRKDKANAEFQTIDSPKLPMIRSSPSLTKPARRKVRQMDRQARRLTSNRRSSSSALFLLSSVALSLV
jgi:hypothetical protein